MNACLLEFLDDIAYLAHAAYKVGFSNILSLLDDPPMDDLNNFLGYIHAWAVSVEGHHDAEGTHALMSR